MRISRDMLREALVWAPNQNCTTVEGRVGKNGLAWVKYKFALLYLYLVLLQLFPRFEHLKFGDSCLRWFQLMNTTPACRQPSLHHHTMDNYAVANSTIRVRHLHQLPSQRQQGWALGIRVCHRSKNWVGVHIQGGHFDLFWRESTWWPAWNPWRQ